MPSISSPSLLPRLPLEVWEIIFRTVSTRKDLKSLCLVNKTFYTLAQNVLYSDLAWLSPDVGGRVRANLSFFQRRQKRRLLTSVRSVEWGVTETPYAPYDKKLFLWVVGGDLGPGPTQQAFARLTNIHQQFAAPQAMNPFGNAPEALDTRAFVQFLANSMPVLRQAGFEYAQALEEVPLEHNGRNWTAYFRRGGSLSDQVVERVNGIPEHDGIRREYHFGEYSVLPWCVSPNLSRKMAETLVNFPNLHELTFRKVVLPRHFHSILPALLSLRTLVLDLCRVAVTQVGEMAPAVDHSDLPLTHLTLRGLQGVALLENFLLGIGSLITVRSLRSLVLGISTDMATLFRHMGGNPESHPVSPLLESVEIEMDDMLKDLRATPTISPVCGPVETLQFALTVLSSAPAVKRFFLSSFYIPANNLAFPYRASTLLEVKGPLRIVQLLSIQNRLEKIEITGFNSAAAEDRGMLKDIGENAPGLKEMNIIMNTIDLGIIDHIAQAFDQLRVLKIRHAPERGLPEQDIFSLGGNCLSRMPQLKTLHVYPVKPEPRAPPARQNAQAQALHRARDSSADNFHRNPRHPAHAQAHAHPQYRHFDPNLPQQEQMYYRALEYYEVYNHHEFGLDHPHQNPFHEHHPLHHLHHHLHHPPQPAQNEPDQAEDQNPNQDNAPPVVPLVYSEPLEDIVGDAVKGWARYCPQLVEVQFEEARAWRRPGKGTREWVRREVEE